MQKETHWKYTSDDMSIAQAVNLLDCLIPNPEPNPPRPFEHHDHTNHTLPSENYQLQEQLDNLVEYSRTNQMKINENKTKVMIFNTRRKYDGRPKLAVEGEGYLEVVEVFKLLGVMVRSDLKWSDNSEYICKKAYARLWMLRRLSNLGATKGEMVDVYQKQVRSVLEMAVPVWQAGLNKQDAKQIERVQRTAFYIILGDEYGYYENAPKELQCDRLTDRRYKLCQNFVKKAVKHPQFKSWFVENSDPTPNFETRSRNTATKTKYQPVRTRTDRFQNSPLPYLTNILNTLSGKKWLTTDMLEYQYVECYLWIIAQETPCRTNFQQRLLLAIVLNGLTTWFE